MANHGYGFVTDKGFSSFARDLEAGAWKDISVEGYDVVDRVPEALLIEAPRPVVWKLRIRWSLADLDAALSVAAPAALAVFDTEWDGAQRALNLFLGAAAESREAPIREAAGRLRVSLLKGAGIEQNNQSYDGEVDFGRHQLLITAKAPLDADVAAVGLGPHLTRIDEATEALARGIGRGPGEKRSVARSKRIRETMSQCTTAFNAIHDEIDWILPHTPRGAWRDRLAALQAPLAALLERHPPRALPPEEGPEAAEPGKEPA